MGVLIKIAGATFTNYIDTVDIPDEPECEHNIVHYAAVAPTATDDGNVEYWHCTVCGWYWLDEALTIATTADGVVLPAIGVYPVTDTLKGLYYLGGTQDDSLVDQSGNGNDATVTGTGVTFADGYASFTENGNLNRINTPILPTTDKKTTIVALFRVPTGYRSIVANYKSSNNGFIFTNYRVEVVTSGAFDKTAYPSAINSNNFAICAWTIDQNGFQAVKDSGGDHTQLAAKEIAVDTFKQNIVIGGYYTNVSYNDNADIALVSIHEGELSDPQLKQIFAFVRNYGESKGLTIE